MEREKLAHTLAGFLSTKKPFTELHPTKMVELSKDILQFFEALSLLKRDYKL